MLHHTLEKMVGREAEFRREVDARHEKRLDNIESLLSSRFESRLSTIEGQLKGMNGTLSIIKEWFVNNAGKKLGGG